VGPAYFKSARKCHIFGIVEEAKSLQINYLIDEANIIGKGSNAVVSMVHHYLDTKQPGRKLRLHADNCVGQNKNNTILGYLMWRTCVGLSDSVELSFMLEGHTKFAPDRMFGLLKREYARSTIDTICDVVAAVQRSSPGGHNAAQLTVDPLSQQQYVKWYDWSSFLERFFKPLPHITSYYHFR
jgi:hypothetical protein